MEAIKKQNERPYWEALQDELKSQLEATRKNPRRSPIEINQDAVFICTTYLKKLQDFAIAHSFANPKEEIHFFKTIKPFFYSQLLFYHRLFSIEVEYPIASEADQMAYLQNEKEKCANYLEENKFYYQYYRSGATYLDDKLFLRTTQHLLLPGQVIDRYYHPEFSTSHDAIFAHLRANELLIDHLAAQLNTQKEASPSARKLSGSPVKTLEWTESKSALIELIYAFKAKGSFNHGKATLKEISDYLQLIFHVELNNPSRDFQEILRRKTGYTIYLDSLQQNYLKYIDDIESKER